MRAYTGLVCVSLIATQAAPLVGAPPTFATREVLPLVEPIITMADINNDGFSDIVAAVPDTFPFPSQYRLNIQLGNAQGSFRQGPLLDLGPGFFPNAIANGDFNGDGLQDIAIVSSNLRALYVLIQQPSGGFLINAIQMAADTSQTLNMAVGDVNRDKLPDLVIPTASGTLILLNSGGGTFRTPVFASLQPSQFALVADLNHDNKPDLVLSGGFCCSTGVSVLLGDGRGAFDSPAAQPQVGYISPRIALADFNRDGKPDLAVTGGSPMGVLISYGNGDGTFGTPYSINLQLPGAGGISVNAADINGDGAADLVVLANSQSEAALILFLNGGQGAFGPTGIYPVPSIAGFAGFGDVNGDSHLDAVVSSTQGTGVSILLNNGNGGFRDGETLATSFPPQSLAAGDFNSDGMPDLVAVTANGLTPYLNSGNNKSLFTPLPTLPFSGQTVVTGDFNSDGRVDVAVLNNGIGQTLLGNGNGSFFYLPGSFYLAPYPPAAIAADMNGDGKLDIVSSFPSIALGKGDGSFAPGIGNTGFYCYSTASVSVADFNRDGKRDVLTACQGYMYLYPGNGDGTLGNSTVPSYAAGIQSAAVGDFNRDGIPDIVFSSNPSFYLPGSTQVNILIGQGDNTFLSGTSIPALTGQGGQLIVADFSGNGVIDIAVLDSYDSVFSVIRGNGDGTFKPAQVYGIATNPACMVSGRFRSGSKLGERDLAFCTGPGIGVAINTTQ